MPIKSSEFIPQTTYRTLGVGGIEKRKQRNFFCFHIAKIQSIIRNLLNNIGKKDIFWNYSARLNAILRHNVKLVISDGITIIWSIFGHKSSRGKWKLKWLVQYGNEGNISFTLKWISFCVFWFWNLEKWSGSNVRHFELFIIPNAKYGFYIYETRKLSDLTKPTVVSNPTHSFQILFQ